MIAKPAFARFWETWRNIPKRFPMRLMPDCPTLSLPKKFTGRRLEASAWILESWLLFHRFYQRQIDKERTFSSVPVSIHQACVRTMFSIQFLPILLWFLALKRHSAAKSIKRMYKQYSWITSLFIFIKKYNCDNGKHGKTSLGCCYFNFPYYNKIVEILN